jgi:hypothetical protein
MSLTIDHGFAEAAEQARLESDVAMQTALYQILDSLGADSVERILFLDDTLSDGDEVLAIERSSGRIFRGEIEKYTSKDRNVRAIKIGKGRDALMLTEGILHKYIVFKICEQAAELQEFEA